MLRNPYTKEELNEYEGSVRESGQVMVCLNYYRVLATIDAAALCGMDIEKCNVMKEKRQRRKESAIMIVWTLGAVLVVYAVTKVVAFLTTGQ